MRTESNVREDVNKVMRLRTHLYSSSCAIDSRTHVPRCNPQARRVGAVDILLRKIGQRKARRAGAVDILLRKIAQRKARLSTRVSYYIELSATASYSQDSCLAVQNSIISILRALNTQDEKTARHLKTKIVSFVYTIQTSPAYVSLHPKTGLSIQ